MTGSGRGGARAGAGRPRVSLDELVRERRFDWRNRRHRRALLEDELSPALLAGLELDSWHPAGTARLIEAYRSAQVCGLRSSASGLAQTFERIVRGEL